MPSHEEQLRDEHLKDRLLRTYFPHDLEKRKLFEKAALEAIKDYKKIKNPSPAESFDKTFDDVFKNVLHNDLRSKFIELEMERMYDEYVLAQIDEESFEEIQLKNFQKIVLQALVACAKQTDEPINIASILEKNFPKKMRGPVHALLKQSKLVEIDENENLKFKDKNIKFTLATKATLSDEILNKHHAQIIVSEKWGEFKPKKIEDDQVLLHKRLDKVYQCGYTAITSLKKLQAHLTLLQKINAALEGIPEDNEEARTKRKLEVYAEHQRKSGQPLKENNSAEEHRNLKFLDSLPNKIAALKADVQLSREFEELEDGQLLAALPGEIEKREKNLKDFKKLSKKLTKAVANFNQNLLGLYKKGYDLHLMSELPNSPAEYKNSYIFIKKNDTQKLYYIKPDGVCETVKINNFNLFEEKIGNIEHKDKTKLHLSEEQIKEIVTLNGGYTHKKKEEYYKESYNKIVDILLKMDAFRKDKVLKEYSGGLALWSKIHQLEAEKLARKHDRLTLESSLAGYLFDGLSWGTTWSIAEDAPMKQFWIRMSEEIAATSLSKKQDADNPESGWVHLYVFKEVVTKSAFYTDEWQRRIKPYIEQGKLNGIKMFVYSLEGNTRDRPIYILDKKPKPENLAKYADSYIFIKNPTAKPGEPAAELFYVNFNQENKSITLEQLQFNAEKGCDLHLMSELPNSPAEYKNSYIFIKKGNTQKLYYIKPDGVCETVGINNFDLFEEKISNIEHKDKTKLHLSEDQIKEVITLNGGHTRKKERNFLIANDVIKQLTSNKRKPLNEKVKDEKYSKTTPYGTQIPLTKEAQALRNIIEQNPGHQYDVRLVESKGNPHIITEDSHLKPWIHEKDGRPGEDFARAQQTLQDKKRREISGKYMMGVLLSNPEKVKKTLAEKRAKDAKEAEEQALPVSGQLNNLVKNMEEKINGPLDNLVADLNQLTIQSNFSACQLQYKAYKKIEEDLVLIENKLELLKDKIPESELDKKDRLMDNIGDVKESLEAIERRLNTISKGMQTRQLPPQIEIKTQRRRENANREERSVRREVMNAHRKESKAQQFARGKKEIQDKFISELQLLSIELAKKGNSRIFDELYKDLLDAQEKFFESITPDKAEDHIVQAMQEFRATCYKHANEVDKVMGHGWLYRIGEVALKAVTGLFASIGMVLGALVGQGILSKEHREGFKNTFFTFNQTEATQRLNEFKSKISEMAKEAGASDEESAQNKNIKF